ncbi:MAG: site-specific integrase [Actinomycetota bacterium]|nr:site-specific integrase [Actinomycetota bacterium]
MSSKRKHNGEGSVWQRSDGRWSGAAYVPLPGGRIERRYVYGKTEDETWDRVRQMLDNADKGIPTTPAGLTVTMYLEEWLDYIKAHVRPSTYAGYESNIRLHLIPRIGKKLLVKLSVRDVRLMVTAMRKDDMKPRSVQYAHATLRTALEHACREELLARNVAKLVRVEQPLKDDTTPPYTVAEAKALLRAVTDDRLAAMWTVILLLGLRRSEVCGLYWSDVDLDAGTLRIARGVHRVNGALTALPTKTRRSTRTVPLPELGVRALTAYRDAQHRLRAEQGLAWAETDYLFTTRHGTPIEPRNLTRMFAQLCVKHGLRRIRLHDLRHSCVSLLLALGVHPRVVMEIVGHSAIEMTMNVYGHVNLDVQRRALDTLDEELTR